MPYDGEAFEAKRESPHLVELHRWRKYRGPGSVGEVGLEVAESLPTKVAHVHVDGLVVEFEVVLIVRRVP